MSAFYVSGKILEINTRNKYHLASGKYKQTQSCPLDHTDLWGREILIQL